MVMHCDCIYWSDVEAGNGAINAVVFRLTGAMAHRPTLLTL